MGWIDELEGPVKDLGKDIFTSLEEQGRQFVKTQGPEFRDFLAEISADLAKETWRAKTATNDAERADARDNMELYLMAIESKLASASLDLVAEGQTALLGIIRAVGKALISVAITLL